MLDTHNAKNHHTHHHGAANCAETIREWLATDAPIAPNAAADLPPAIHGTQILSGRMVVTIIAKGAAKPVREFPEYHNATFSQQIIGREDGHILVRIESLLDPLSTDPPYPIAGRLPADAAACLSSPQASSNATESATNRATSPPPPSSVTATAGASSGADEWAMMRALAMAIVGDAHTVLTAIERIGLYVRNRVSYDLHTANDALSVIRNRRGKCDGFSNAIVALARAAGLPARVANGWCLPNFDINTPDDGGNHAFAEFFVPSIGWMFCEPQGSLHFTDPFRLVDVRDGDFDILAHRTDLSARHLIGTAADQSTPHPGFSRRFRPGDQPTASANSAAIAIRTAPINQPAFVTPLPSPPTATATATATATPKGRCAAGAPMAGSSAPAASPASSPAAPLVSPTISSRGSARSLAATSSDGGTAEKGEQTKMVSRIWGTVFPLAFVDSRPMAATQAKAMKLPSAQHLTLHVPWECLHWYPNAADETFTPIDCPDGRAELVLPLGEYRLAIPLSPHVRRLRVPQSESSVDWLALPIVTPLGAPVHPSSTPPSSARIQSEAIACLQMLCPQLTLNPAIGDTLAPALSDALRQHRIHAGTIACPPEFHDLLAPLQPANHRPFRVMVVQSADAPPSRLVRRLLTHTNIARWPTSSGHFGLAVATTGSVTAIVAAGFLTATTTA